MFIDVVRIVCEFPSQICVQFHFLYVFIKVLFFFLTFNMIKLRSINREMRRSKFEISHFEIVGYFFATFDSKSNKA